MKQFDPETLDTEKLLERITEELGAICEVAKWAQGTDRVEKTRVVRVLCQILDHREETTLYADCINYIYNGVSK